jgi:hypothetical protein
MVEAHDDDPEPQLSPETSSAILKQASKRCPGLANPHPLDTILLPETHPLTFKQKIKPS